VQWSFSAQSAIHKKTALTEYRRCQNHLTGCYSSRFTGHQTQYSKCLLRAFFQEKLKLKAKARESYIARLTGKPDEPRFTITGSGSWMASGNCAAALMRPSIARANKQLGQLLILVRLIRTGLPVMCVSVVNSCSCAIRAMNENEKCGTLRVVCMGVKTIGVARGCGCTPGRENFLGWIYGGKF